MTNQTKTFSVLGVTSGLADVTDLANRFIEAGTAHGLSGFCVRQVVVTQGDASFTRNWHTVQVDYYDPAVM